MRSVTKTRWIMASSAWLLSTFAAQAQPTWVCTYAPKGIKGVSLPLTLQEGNAELTVRAGEGTMRYEVLESVPDALIAAGSVKIYDRLKVGNGAAVDPATVQSRVPVGAAVSLITLDRGTGLFTMTALNSKAGLGEVDEGRCNRRGN